MCFELLHFPFRLPSSSVNGWLCSIVFQEGRTPLHYAAALQGTTGGANRLFNLLLDSGADENIVDVVRPDVIYNSPRPIIHLEIYQATLWLSLFYAQGFLCQIAANYNAVSFTKHSLQPSSSNSDCKKLRAPIGQRLKSAPQEDFFYVAMLRYDSCPSCQEGFFNVE